MNSPRTQLWKEEYEILSSFVSTRTPKGGVIVEIGTAEGGTSFLMQSAVTGKDIDIYTVDPFPSPSAYDILSGVKMIVKPSEEFAREWDNVESRKIDFLFIDGNHDLEHVTTDWNLWSRFLKPGGLVAFHDFDPVWRGGISHLAVRVCVETVINSGLIENPSHQYKLLSGVVPDPSNAFVETKKFSDTLIAIGAHIERARQFSVDGAVLLGDERLVLLLKGCLPGAVFMDSESVFDPHAKYLIGMNSEDTFLSKLEASNVPRPNILTLDSLTICYLLATCLKTNYTHLMKTTADLKEFLVWVETLAMFDHAFGSTFIPSKSVDLPDDLDLYSLSQIVAREQVRLTLLSRMMRTFVDWTP